MNGGRALVSAPTVGVALAALALGCAFAQPEAPLPADRYLYLPPAWADRVVYYHGFDASPGEPDLNDLAATIATPPTATTTGFAGKALATPLGPETKAAYQVTADGLSPHRPVTLMGWFRLDQPAEETTWYNLLRLWSAGSYITHFVAGKGEWCALREPTFIFQVVAFPGIRQYHNSWAGAARFTPGEWHHVALTVTNASNLRFYRDGTLVDNILIKGRPFRESDAVRHATFGSDGLPISIDEVLVLDRALLAEEVQDYVTAARQLHDIGYGPLAP